MSLASAFQIPIDEVRPTGALYLKELDASAPLAEAATRFATACRAFSEFQDLQEVEIPVTSDGPLHNRHYCYYESLVYLREIVHCLLHGNLLASMTLVRPFLELAVLHVYWRARDDEYVQYYRWLSSGKGRPPFRNAVDELVKLLPTASAAGQDRVSKLGEELRVLYAQACEYNHVASFDNSYVSISAGNHRITLDAAAAALGQATITLRQVLYLYCLAYPMALFECPPEKKFGFGGPVGMFASHELAALVEAALGSRNSARMRAALAGHEDVQARMQWYDSQPNLSSEALEREWRDHLTRFPVADDPQDLTARLALVRAQHRGIMWSMNYLGIEAHASSEDSPEIRAEYKNLMNW